MKDKALVIFSCIGFIFLMGFCAYADAEDYKKQLPKEIEQLELAKEALEKEIDELERELDGLKVESGVARYIITYEIQPSSNSLSLSDMMKAEDSEFTWSVYVDKQTFDTCEIGDTTHIGASYMDYNITITDKTID